MKYPKNTSGLKKWILVQTGVKVAVHRYRDSANPADPDYTIKPETGKFSDDFCQYITSQRKVPAKYKNTCPDQVRLPVSEWHKVFEDVVVGNVGMFEKTPSGTEDGRPEREVGVGTAAVAPGVDAVSRPETPAGSSVSLGPTSSSTTGSSVRLDLFETIQALVTQKGTDPANYSAADIALIRSYEGRGGLAKEGVRGTGILNEFYTPDAIVRKMMALAHKYGFTANGLMLEPACGVGRFFAYHNPRLTDAYEVDPVSYAIAKVLYPEVNITHGSFESAFYTGNFHTPNRVVPKYDLVVGNPPYENYKSGYPAEKDATGAHTFDQYFVVRGVDVLKPGGLLIMIIPSTFLRNGNKYNALKKRLEEKAQLVDAYRLPNGAFPNTYIGTDIIIMKKL